MTGLASPESPTPSIALAAIVVVVAGLFDLPLSVTVFVSVVGGAFLLMGLAQAIDVAAVRRTDGRLTLLAELATRAAGDREAEERGRRLAERLARGRAPLPPNRAFHAALRQEGPLRGELLRVALLRGSGVDHAYLEVFEAAVEAMGPEDVSLLERWLWGVHVADGHTLRARYDALEARAKERLGAGVSSGGSPA